ncbi:MAG: F0F1 ATP synthase subunit A [Lepagella sp.]
MRLTSKLLYGLLALLLGILCPTAAYATPEDGDTVKDESSLDVKEIIFHHLGDGYGWEVPFAHIYRIPLPVIVRAQDGTWHSFSSSKLTQVQVIKETVRTKDGQIKTEEKEELIPVIHRIVRGDEQYDFLIAHTSQHKNKVVQVFPLSAEEQAAVEARADSMRRADNIPAGEHAVIPGYVFYDVDGHGQYYREYKPFDISITKNVLALFIAAFIVWMLCMILVRHYKKYGFRTPRKGMGFFEMLIDFIYVGTIRNTLKEKADKFAPYLLTCFFFILVMNLLGLVVIFPGGANLTGNIAITLVLSLLTFVMVNIHGNKHYWKEIFWPDVPIWLKCPLPIMQVIEVFGTLTKPAALCVRLFANMMGGHMIVITLTVLIFIFAAFGAAAAGSSIVISILFSTFMLALDVLVSFIQAYVFTMLSTIFISLAVHNPEHHESLDQEVEEAMEKSENPQTAGM